MHLAGGILRLTHLNDASGTVRDSREGCPLIDERLNFLKDSLGPRVVFQGNEAVSGQVEERLAILRKSAYDGQVTTV